MSRCPVCGVEPLECECSIGDSDCIEVGGSGFTGNPLTFLSKIDPDPNNLLSCGPDGLELETDPLLDRPAAQVTRTTNQTVSGGFVTTVVDFTSIRYDTDGMADLSGDALVIQTPGIYTVTFICRWLTPAGLVAAAITVDNAVIGAHFSQEASGFNNSNFVCVTRSFGAGAVLQVLVDSQATRDLEGTDWSPNFAAVWERRLP